MKRTAWTFLSVVAGLALCCGARPSLAQCLACGPSTVALWKCDEGTANVLTDSCSGIAVTASAANGWVPGFCGPFAAELYGPGYFANASGPFAFLTPPFTVEAMIYLAPNQGQDSAILAQYEGTNDKGFALRATLGRLNLMIGHGTPGAVSMAWSPPNQLQTGQWYHVAGDFDGSTVRVFVDGQVVGATSAPSGMVMDASPFRIGCGWNPDGIQDFEGYLDEIRISSGIIYPCNQGTATTYCPGNPWSCSPALTVGGNLSCCAPVVNVDLTGVPLGVTLPIVSIGQAPLSPGCGGICLQPPLFFGPPLPIMGSAPCGGTLSFSSPVPPSVPCPFTFFLQFAILDYSSPCWYSTSPAVQVSIVQ